MKLILTIINDNDNEAVSQALTGAGLRVTRISSTGGFMRRGSSTLLIGVEDGKVDEAIQLIKNFTTTPTDPTLHRATLFVLPVAGYTQI